MCYLQYESYSSMALRGDCAVAVAVAVAVAPRRGSALIRAGRMSMRSPTPPILLVQLYSELYSCSYS